MYEDETGYQKGQIQKRKIVETEIFSVDERIKIISGIIAVMGKDEEESTSGRYPHVLSCQIIKSLMFHNIVDATT